MVTTRARAASLAARKTGSNRDSKRHTSTDSGSSSSGSSDSSSSSSSSSTESSEKKQRPRETTNDHNAEPKAEEQPEMLGRGCRIRRPTLTLEEEYTSMMASSSHSMRHKRGSRFHKRGADDTYDDGTGLVLHHRYPQREAAKLAIARLAGGSSSDDSSDSDDDDDEKRSNRRKAALLNRLKQRGSGRDHSRKRLRSTSVDSDISIESFRAGHSDGADGNEEGNDGRDGDRDRKERLLEKGASDSSGSSAPSLNASEEDRAFRNAKESKKLNVDINHFLNNLVKSDARRSTGQSGEKSSASRGIDAGLSFKNDGSGEGGEKDSDVKPGDVTPLKVDPNVSFDSVGGLPQHIVALREMVLLPLLYPQLMQTLHVTPPRGVLFVGPPGTGKTLLARALASEGMRATNQKVTFFMRKGADVLSKWVGESERQLSILFEEAKRMQPSIIFFDEIDGLAPIRHSKVEQTQAALVSTFLALMDGLDDRGNVVIIGATNRPDTIDPALRRPGRFDRELRFPLPDAAARRHILRIQTEKLLPDSRPDRDTIIDELVSRSEGWSGADIKALCTEAGMVRLRSTLPQLYTTSARLVVPPAVALEIRREDFFVAAHRLQPSMKRASCSRSSVDVLEEHNECLLRSTRHDLLESLKRSWRPVRSALLQQNRDCADVHEAALEMSSVVIPETSTPAFLALVEGGPLMMPEKGAAKAMPPLRTALNLTSSLIKSLPTFHHRSVHLFHLAMDMSASGDFGGSAGVGMSVDADTASFDAMASSLGATSAQQGGHLFAFLQSLRTCSPAIVVLLGVDEWLHDNYPFTEQQLLPESVLDDDNKHDRDEGRGSTTSGHTAERRAADDCRRAQQMRALRYYLAELAHVNILFVIPTRSAMVLDRLLGEETSATLTGAVLPPSFPPLRGNDVLSPTQQRYLFASSAGGTTTPHQRIVFSIPLTPQPRDLFVFFSYAYHVVHLTLEATVPRQTPPLAIDDSPPPPPPPTVAREALMREWEAWRRVDYRRRQLRHILTKWVSQYVNSRKFMVLLSSDLDFHEGTDGLESWRAHTSGREMSLQIIMEKLEREEYTCLSQYHDDIDVLVHNVRSFFRSRSAYDQKYRSRVLELKEITVLNLYKINRSIVKFCEETRDVKQPKRHPSSIVVNDEEPENDENEQAKAVEKRRPLMRVAVVNVGPRKPPTRRYRIFGQRRRRGRRPPIRRIEAPAEPEEHTEKNEAENAASGVDGSATDKSDVEESALQNEEKEEEGEPPAGETVAARKSGSEAGDVQEDTNLSDKAGGEDRTPIRQKGSCNSSTGRASTNANHTNTPRTSNGPSDTAENAWSSIPVEKEGVPYRSLCLAADGLSFAAMENLFAAIMDALQDEVERRRAERRALQRVNVDSKPAASSPEHAHDGTAASATGMKEVDSPASFFTRTATLFIQHTVASAAAPSFGA